MKLVFTGGHHSSALPVIDELKKQFPEWEIYWIGHKHSLKGDRNETLEYKEITQRRIPFYELRTGKVYKVYNPFVLAKVITGFFQSYNIIKNLKPDLIVSFGGYLAVPVVISAYLQKIPSITHEQTLVAGYANKVIGMFANKILLSWESSKRFFNSNKTIVTGIPLRSSIFNVISTNFVTDNNLPYLFILGGKSGSHVLNEVVINAMPVLLTKYNVIHQCGDYSVFNDFNKAGNEYSKIKDSVNGIYFVRKFIMENEIGEAYFKATLVISRSGAHSIAEILALHKRALFIPIPWVSHDEQNANAEYVAEKGLARILLESNLSPDTLIAEIEKTISDVDVSNVTSNLINLDATEKIVNEIVSALQNKKN